MTNTHSSDKLMQLFFPILLTKILWLLKKLYFFCLIVLLILHIIYTKRNRENTS